MSKAVVTGGSGFLGSHIADTLTERGFEVTLFDLRPSPYRRPGQKMVVGDVRDAEVLDTACSGAEIVYHLAGLADLNAALERPLEAAEMNVLGTVNVLEAARAAGVRRFLFASTVYVYSRAGGFYRCSKQACEAYIEEYLRQWGLKFTILRYGSLYGPRADASNGVFRLLQQAVEKGRIRHVGRPDDSREYVHVEDAARLSVDALDDEYENRHLLISGHSPMRLRDLFTMFSEIMGRTVEVEYQDTGDALAEAHYRVTPYAYNPTVGRKLTSNYYVDMGQGILQMLEQLQTPEEDDGA